VNWDVITEPKEGGGLRVRVARNHNINILGKLVWDLLHLNNQLWVSLLRDKYFLDENLFMAEGRKGSMTWNAIMKVMKHFQEGLE